MPALIRTRTQRSGTRTVLDASRGYIEYEYEYRPGGLSTSTSTDRAMQVYLQVASANIAHVQHVTMLSPHLTL